MGANSISIFIQEMFQCGSTSQVILYDDDKSYKQGEVHDLPPGYLATFSSSLSLQEETEGRNPGHMSSFNYKEGIRDEMVLWKPKEQEVADHCLEIRENVDENTASVAGDENEGVVEDSSRQVCTSDAMKNIEGCTRQNSILEYLCGDSECDDTTVVPHQPRHDHQGKTNDNDRNHNASRGADHKHSSSLAYRYVIRVVPENNKRHFPHKLHTYMGDHPELTLRRVQSDGQSQLPCIRV